MIAMVRALTSFVEERPIVARERRFYGALPYLLAKIVAEGPLDALFAGLFGYMVHKLCHMNGAPRRFTFFFWVFWTRFSRDCLGIWHIRFVSWSHEGRPPQVCLYLRMCMC